MGLPEVLITTLGSFTRLFYVETPRMRLVKRFELEVLRVEVGMMASLECLTPREDQFPVLESVSELRDYSVSWKQTWLRRKNKPGQLTLMYMSSPRRKTLRRIMKVVTELWNGDVR